MQASFASFRRSVLHPVRYRLFLLSRLPAAFFAGVRAVEVTETRAIASVRYGWFTRNPFRSIYFAVLSMAAELSTGLLCMGHIALTGRRFSLLITGMQGEFYKKATGPVKFICEDGALVAEALQQSLQSGEPRQVTCLAQGFAPNGERLCAFRFTWSFKPKPEPEPEPEPEQEKT